ncbi:MAG: DUF1592 domain-containing protein, partial [Myxococcota bacterium]
MFRSLEPDVLGPSGADGDSAVPGTETDYPAPDTPAEAAAAVFRCTPGVPREERGAHVLTKRQLENTVVDLFGPEALDAAAAAFGVLPQEVFDDVYHVRQSGLSDEKVESYYAIARAVAAHVTGDEDRTAAVFGSCATVETLEATCSDAFIHGYAERILRRPLNGDESAFVKQLVDEGSGTVRERLRAVLTYLLASPGFIWRVEESAEQRTPYELATDLAYTFTNSTPDANLARKAADGALSTLEEVRSEARRLMSTARGKSKLVDAIARWSVNDRTEDLSNLPPEILAGSDPNALSSAMIEEARRFIEEMVFERGATFEELLTSPLSFAADPDLAALYGHAPASLDAP